MGMGIDWTHRADYMLARHGVTTTEANEALTDPNRLTLTPDPASRTGASDRTIGYSPTAGTVLVIITVTENGVTYGINGWDANTTAQRIYKEGL